MRTHGNDANISPVDTSHPLSPTPADGWYRKRRYHHGNLRSSALARGRQVVTLRGPAALTLRGLARDLGVTATSLVREFGNVAGMRAGVAESALELLRAEARLTPGHRIPTEEAAGRWVAFAAAQPNLYRLMSGEGWHAPGSGHYGIHGMLAVRSPLRTLEDALCYRSRRLGNPRGDPEQACYLASAIHGLALARIDGVAEVSVEKALARALQPITTRWPTPSST